MNTKRRRSRLKSTAPTARAATGRRSGPSEEAAEKQEQLRAVRPLLEHLDQVQLTQAAAEELELQTLCAFFGHLRREPQDPRITRLFGTQSSGWKVPWSQSGPSPALPPATTDLGVRAGQAASEPDPILAGYAPSPTAAIPPPAPGSATGISPEGTSTFDPSQDDRPPAEPVRFAKLGRARRLR